MNNAKPLFAFFGSSSESIYALDAMEKNGLLPVLIITTPDRPTGRGMKMAPNVVKSWANERGIDVLTPTTLKDEAVVAELSNTDWDVFVVMSYGKILPKAILDIPRKGCINIHPSLLPKFRGPSPIMSAILADERQTGTTVMLMEEKMDTGAIIAQARIEIEEAQWPLKNSILAELLITEGGNLFAETLPHWLSDEITPEEQDELHATYTKKFTDEDARIDLAGNAHTNLLKIRAFDHGPRAYFIDAQGKRVLITEAEVKDDVLEILKVIPEGKKEMSYQDFIAR